MLLMLAKFPNIGDTCHVQFDKNIHVGLVAEKGKVNSVIRVCAHACMHVCACTCMCL